MFQSGALLGSLTVGENVALPLQEWTDLPPDAIGGLVTARLRLVGLQRAADQLPSELSGGMRKRAAIARAMALEPELIFLDEPSAGLDPVAAVALRDDLARLVAREGVTVFLTTHNLGEAEKLCGQVAVIRQGQLMAVGHPDELRARGGGPHVEIIGRGFDLALLARLRARPEVEAVELTNGRLLLTLRDGAETAPIITALVSAGAQVSEVHRGQASLEDVFMTLMNEERRQ
jgi:ABC-2 type transport system ATP-binding protein